MERLISLTIFEGLTALNILIEDFNRMFLGVA